MNASDYYRILEIPENAGVDEIKNAFRRKAKAYHPDINKSEEAHQRFVDINEAYNYLMDLHNHSLNSGGATSGTFSRDDYYRQWVQHERQKARERAARQARMRYEEFRRSTAYRTTTMLSHLLDYFLLLLGLFVIIAAGFGLYMQGLYIEQNGEEVLNTGGIIADIVITVAGILFIIVSWSNIRHFRKNRKKTNE
jgi:hypothetical protein